jgi:hypothetical protein
MVFNDENAKAILKRTLLEETKTEAVFTFDTAIVRINSRFHQPSIVTIIKKDSEETLGFGYETMGYNFEIDHFNALIRNNTTASDLMTFEFSKDLIHLLDIVKKTICFAY